MSSFVEPFLQDIIWLWLAEQQEYSAVYPEVRIGDGVNSGRVDLVGKTKDGEYHGFEIKNDDSAFEQVNRYTESGQLDRVYHCSRVTDIFSHYDVKEADSERDWQHEREVPNVKFLLRELALELSNGIAAGQYSKADVFDALDSTFPDSILSMNLNQAAVERDIAEDIKYKTIESALDSYLGPPSADYRPDEDHLTIAEAMNRIRNRIAIPNAGVIRVPVALQYVDEGFDNDPQWGPHYEFQNDIEVTLDRQKTKQVEIIREAPPLERHSKPTVTRNHEAWIQHHLWRSKGSIREAQIPLEQTVGIIDVLQFQGTVTATEAFRTPEKCEIAGIEAKTKSGLQDEVSVQNQLRAYLNSGALSRLYLGVPVDSIEIAQTVIESSDLRPVGILSVDNKGAIEVVESALRLELQYDGFRSQYGYQREIGYGNVLPDIGKEYRSLKNLE